MKKVKIIQCTMKRPLNWYEHRVGEVVEVVQENGDNTLFVYDKRRLGPAIILWDDVEEYKE